MGELCIDCGEELGDFGPCSCALAGGGSPVRLAPARHRDGSRRDVRTTMRAMVAKKLARKKETTP